MMNKQIVNKLIQFLKILEHKIIDNIDFFIDMKISFQSGTKVFEAFITLNNNKINFKFNGKTEIFEITNLSNVVFKETLNYDSANILYRERGLNIIVTADSKNVSMKTTQNTIENIKKSHSELLK